MDYSQRQRGTKELPNEKRTEIVRQLTEDCEQHALTKSCNRHTLTESSEHPALT